MLLTPIALSLALAALPVTEPVSNEEAVRPPARAHGAFLRDYAETRRFMAGRPAMAGLTPDGTAALFLRSSARSAVQSLYETNLLTGETRLLADAEKLLAGASQELSVEERARLERQRISARGLTHYEVARDGRHVAVGLGGKLFLLDRSTGAVKPLAAMPGFIDPRFAPDAKRIAFVRDGDLRVLDLQRNVERRLTRGASDDVTHGLAEFVAQEEMDRYQGYWWSPDSKLIAYQRTDVSGVERFTIADPVHPERAASVFPYPRAGRQNASVKLGVVPAAGGKTTWISWDAERYPYLCAVVWQRGGPLTLYVMDRAQQHGVLLAADVRSGATRTLLEERDPAWINLYSGFPAWREDGKGFFWATERNGAPEVELRAPGGERVATWVAPEHGFGRLVGYDDARRTLWFTGGEDPTQDALFAVEEGGSPRRMAIATPAVVSAKLANDAPVLLVSRADAREMPRTIAVRADGARLAELPSVAESPSIELRAEIRKVGAGEGIWAEVVRPRDFTPGRKLPVIVDVYGGPHAQQVKHYPALLSHWMADQGFIVVSFDGRGTPRRGRAWERAIRGDFAGPTLDDQVAGLTALAAEVPELDLGRVGIVGWSFGGYMSALAVLRRPDVFRAAVSGSAVTEWRDYDTFYTERYLGLPADDPAAYDRSSLLPDAPKLERPLLLIHGTADDNVYFMHSLKLSDALFLAGRPHQFLPLTGFTHMVPEPLTTQRLEEKIVKFFEEAL
ncbi:MAG TPA: DPP IV N-terminal domain-containing protein [Anaeromyxobacteraceae bacterium]|nr:DPP IV N-terminal domain-containing protein [Anaeromyxobacteraceae bacterium]